jgi:hypothetical protein
VGRQTTEIGKVEVTNGERAQKKGGGAELTQRQSADACGPKKERCRHLDEKGKRTNEEGRREA